MKHLSERTYSLTADIAHFKIHGRHIPLAEGLGCDHTMSGIEFAGVMYGQVKVSLACTADTYFTVFVDGERTQERLAATAQTAELTIADLDTAKEHRVCLLKQTEPQLSLCTLKSVTLTGELGAAPEKKELYIEFLGDSITCGYGNLGDLSSPDPGCAFWEDGSKAFAALSALDLDADFSMISCSGIGVHKGYPYFDMLQYYQKASFFRDQITPCTFCRVPDIIVINLGTNDAGLGAEQQGFTDSVHKLITFVRAFYGKDVPIVWVHNMMNECRFAWTETVIGDMGGESADIYTVRAQADHSGTNGHPALGGHAAAAQLLTQKIIEILQAE